MAVYLTPITLTGMITLVFLILTIIFGIMIKKAIYFKLHKIFAGITIISALVHAYLVFSRII